MKTILKIFIYLSALFLPMQVYASQSPTITNLTDTPYAVISLFFFVFAYLLVMAEEYLHLRKSKPVILCAGIIWTLFALASKGTGDFEIAHRAIDENIVEYAKLFLFLLAAMTYVNAIEERNVFATLRAYLVQKGFSYKTLFWITGALSFFISPIADNLTTALIMCAVVMAVGKESSKFISLSCINIVVAANAGGAFSPFGDITTLMVWSDGKLPFNDFFYLFLPSVVNFLVPAICMHFAIPTGKPAKLTETIQMKFGAKRIILLFLLTIITAVVFHNYLHLPPAIGMMTGLAYLQFFGYYVKMRDKRMKKTDGNIFDIFQQVKSAEWDTLLFFYGITLCVGGLAQFGYLSNISQTIYHDWGVGYSAIHTQTPANIFVGVLSAIIDNIPVMYAILTMSPVMSDGQWMLATLTAGVGGSLLSIGSAAGVALMGQARGHYTFLSHLKWVWAIALGYIASIAVHLWLNHELFSVFSNS